MDKRIISLLEIAVKDQKQRGLPLQTVGRKVTDSQTAARRLPTWVTIISAVIVVLFVLSPPWSILEKARIVGYAVCHQIPSHSFHPGGHQLPLCARCTGTYLGALLGFTTLWALGKGRASNMPPPKALALLAGFIILMAIDGLNSYLAFFPDLPRLYRPSNTLRLITGTLNGLALSIIIYPILNLTLWRNPATKRVLDGLHELSVPLVLDALLILVVRTEVGSLLYPLAILSAVGVLLLLTVVNTLIIVILTRQEGQAATARDAILLFLLGLAATILEIGAMALVRGKMAWMPPASVRY